MDVQTTRTTRYYCPYCGRSQWLFALRPVASEEWDRLVQGRPFHHVRILEMLRQGYTHAEIAAELGFNEKTVQRLIQKIKTASRCRPA